MDRGPFKGPYEGPSVLHLPKAISLNVPQIYIAAINGHVPRDMVQCLSAFINCCYIVRRNAIAARDIARFEEFLADFHRLREVFITEGVRKSISLPRQHALMHYTNAIELFGSPNGTCSSQTEAKHIPVVKEPWRRSSRNKPLPQMLKTINRLDKLAAIRSIFKDRGMLAGGIVEHTALQVDGDLPPILPWNGVAGNREDSGQDGDDITTDAGPASGPRMETMIWLAARHRKSQRASETECLSMCSEREYPTSLQALATFINQPDFPSALRDYIHQQNHPDSDRPRPPDDSFDGPIRVFHSATIQFYAPSDLCGTGGMHREVLRANPSYCGKKRFDTVLVSVGNNDDQVAMRGLMVTRVRLFFSYFDSYHKKDMPCALVTWFIHPGDNPEHDKDTGMWKVAPE
jgi:hypothetical protein